MAKKINPIDYSSRDYESLLSDLRQAAPLLLPEWSNSSDTDFGLVLLELFSYVGDVMNYYIDRVANEMFLATATRRQSILNIAKMLDYTPGMVNPASVTLTFKLTRSAGETVIPAGTVVLARASSSSLIRFETDEDLTIPGTSAATPSESSFIGTVDATEGTKTSNEILARSSSGALNQSYPLFNKNVVYDNVEVRLQAANGVPTYWSRVPSLMHSSSGDHVFSLRTDENNVTYVEFGDNVNGLAPPYGSEIKATYRTSIGSAGNVAANAIREVYGAIEGVSSVTNLSPATGGEDAETVSSVRASLPASLTALNRAVSLNDYAALALKVPGVAKAKASSSVYTNVTLYAAPTGVGGSACSSELKDDIQAYLSDKKMINATVVIADPIYVGVNISATVTVESSYYQSNVQRAVNTALESLTAYSNVDFGKGITISQVYAAIQNVPGVDYAAVSLLVRADATSQSGVNTITTTSGEIIKKGTITLTMSGGVT